MRNRVVFALYAGLFCLGLYGCGAQTDNTVEMKVDFSGQGDFQSPTLYNASGGNFFHNGFPTGIRQLDDGSIDLSDFPRHLQPATYTYLYGIKTELAMRGYHTISPIYIPLTGPLDIESLPTDPLAYTHPDASIQLVDIDPASAEYGRRFPLTVTQTLESDSFRPANLLQILPTLGISLRPDTTYAVLVTDQIPVTAEQQLVQNPQLSSVLMPARDAATIPDKARDLFEPLRGYLAEQNMAPEAVMAATVWHTGDPTAAMRRGAQTAAEMPVAAATDFELVEDFADYCAVRGFVKTPVFQTGFVPYLLRTGRIEWDDSGAPIQQRTRNAEFIVTIPKNTLMPDSGYPLLEFVHGAGGDAEQVFTRGKYLGVGSIIGRKNEPPVLKEYGNGPSQIAAERGWASSGFGGHLGQDQAGSLLGWGLMPYNLANPVSMFNSYYQMVWERVYFRRVLDQIRVPKDLCPQGVVASGEDHFRFDSGMRVLMGQSLGNWVGSLELVADPQPYQGAILTGVAGTWIKFFTNEPRIRTAVSGLLPNLLPSEKMDEMHPFLMLMEWLLGGADPVAYLDRVLKYPSKTAPHVLAISGIDDQSGYEPAQWPHLMALGVDLAGPDLGSDYYETLFPHMSLSGARQLSYPVADNVSVPGQGKRTAAVVRYENTERGDHNGHHVTFDLEAPKHQYGCFLQYLSWHQTPLVFEGTQQGGVCP
ncbi:MAG: hypothetical protein D6160_17760 [Ketobacter sp.]|nr:MAG: hypothetical protein D6160_17760 [Ketobacter sp.]